LKPVESDLDRRLVLKILEKSAELRAPYFLKTIKAPDFGLTFNFVSMTNFWMEIIGLDLPRPFVDDDSLPDEPPSINTMLENLLPSFLDREYLTRGLYYKSALVQYTVCQLLYTCLSQVKRLKRFMSLGGSNWSAEYDVLLERMARRLPDIPSILSLSKTNETLLATCAIKVLVFHNELFSNVGGTRLDAKSLSSALEKEWTLAHPTDILDKINLLGIIQEHSDLTWWRSQGIFLIKWILT
jgi:hypothetical protein